MSLSAVRSAPLSTGRTLQFPIVRNRSRLIAGIGVVALSALLITMLYTRAGHRQQVLALAHDVKAGQVIERSDLRSVGIAIDGSAKTVSVRDAPTIIGKLAGSNLTSGSVLSPDAVSLTAPAPAGQAIVGASMKSGQYPAALRAGDHVLVVATSDSATSEPRTAADSVTATVTDVASVSDTSGQSTVSLQLDVANAALVAKAAASNNLALVILGQ